MGDLMKNIFFVSTLLLHSALWAAMPENERIGSHLRFVHDLLSHRAIVSQTKLQRANRKASLSALKNYYERGIFPENHDFPQARVPYFIDEMGAPCAVAHIMIESGHAGLAADIAQKNNHVYLDQVDDPSVIAWVKQSGFTLDELRLIQPSYSYSPQYSDPLMEQAYLGNDVKVRELTKGKNVSKLKLNLALQVAAKTADAALLKSEKRSGHFMIRQEPPPWVGHWVEVVNILMAEGADPLAKNSQGKSAIDLAKDPAVKEALKTHRLTISDNYK